MRIIKKDLQKLEQERAEREKLKQEEEKAKAYTESLANNRNFQKYVVERIFKKHINALSDNRLLQKGKILSAPPEEVKTLLAGTLYAREQLEKILSELING